MRRLETAIFLIAMGTAMVGGEAKAGCLTYKVRFSTGALLGARSMFMFELTSSGTPGPFDASDAARITSYAADGKESPVVRTFGGPVEGRLAAPGSMLATSSIQSTDGFLSGAVVAFDSLGESFHFDVELLDTSDVAPHPSRFAFYMTSIFGAPYFPTADPTGANALFTLTETDSCEEIMTYAPARFAGPDSILLDTLELTGVQEGSPGLGELRVLRSGPNPVRGAYTLEVEAPAGALNFRVFDIEGRVVYRGRIENEAGGPGSLRWPLIDETGRPVAPGVYFAQVANQRKSIIRKIVVAR